MRPLLTLAFLASAMVAFAVIRFSLTNPRESSADPVVVYFPAAGDSMKLVVTGTLQTEDIWDRRQIDEGMKMDAIERELKLRERSTDDLIRVEGF